jgi:hypothetical protein
MSIDIKFERGVKGYNIVRKNVLTAVLNSSSKFKRTQPMMLAEMRCIILKKTLFAEVCMSTLKYESKPKG